jgi:hypothetical protein
MEEDEADIVVVGSGPSDLIELLAVLFASEGFPVSTQPLADGDAALLAPPRYAEVFRFLTTKPPDKGELTYSAER